jgi:hypothetical protein
MFGCSVNLIQLKKSTKINLPCIPSNKASKISVIM